MTPQEFYESVASDPKVMDAVKRLQNLDPDIDLQMYSYYAGISSEILNADHEELKELVRQIGLANEKKIDIHTIRRMEKASAEQKDGLEMFFEAFEDKENKKRLFLLIGETGVGKSYTVEKRYPGIIKYACNRALDAFSLLYFWGDNKAGDLGLKKTPFHRAVEEGHPVYLDEINELPHETLMLIQGITDEKSDVVFGDKVIPINQNFRIIGTMNPPSETDERIPLGDALLGRAVGHIMTMSDRKIIERLRVNVSWIHAVKKLYNMVATSMHDARNLDFRDYQKIRMFGIDQLKFKFCVNDIRNISAYERIEATDEYQRLKIEFMEANIEVGK